MIRSTTLSAALAAIALAGPAWAQGQMQANPAVREMQRERASSGAAPGVPAQNQIAAAADASQFETAREFLREARNFLDRRNAGRAIEAMERAETRLLTNSVVASEAGQPQDSGALSQIASARRLARQGDMRAALNALDRAEAALLATPSGPGARPLPPSVPTAVDVPPPVPPSAQPPQPQGMRPAVPQGPGVPAERLPPRG
ncbi:hypothetical protein [Roseomonas xinghualingensis]|uniref:hypothetical protein n=1 Tax=Roseomonas xinghualingensis TaxID=2986475 RepID=UPI0021F20F53|nr:hypothetical protein [Roseomonas sp. SXEYE001]MCV4206183.1 hypothetical protein [Roseomonas sp. SXEYE001]